MTPHDMARALQCKLTHRGNRPTGAVLAQWIIGKGWTPAAAEILLIAYRIGERAGRTAKLQVDVEKISS